MMKTKRLSILLAAQMITSVFCGVCVWAEEKTYQTMVDMSSGFNAKCYLSESEANSIASAKKPDWFLSFSDGSGEAVAINRDKLSEYVTDGILTHKGTKYLMPMPDNAPGGMTYQWNGISVPENYYSKAKVLTFTSNTKREKIYASLGYNDGGTDLGNIWNYSRNGTSESTAEFVVDAGVVAPLEGQTVTGTGNIYETTVNLKNTKKLIKFGFGNGGDSIGYQGRVLALTLIQTESDVKKYIDEKVAAVLAKEAPTSAEVLAIKDYMDEKAEQGFDVDKVEGISDFRILEAKFVSIKDYKETTDFEKIKIDINFKAPISESSVEKKNFTVTVKGEEKEFVIEKVKTDEDVTGVTLTLENELNYSDEIEITVSKNIKSAADEKFNLGSDKTIKIVPTAPTLYIKNLKQSVSGANTVVTGEIKNNASSECPYVAIVGIYSDNNEMTSRIVMSGTIAAGDSVNINETLASKGIVEGTLLDGWDNMKILHNIKK